MFLTVLFTGRIPNQLFGLSAMYNRYVWRTTTFALGLRDSYPPFDLETTVDVAKEVAPRLPPLTDDYPPFSLDRGRPRSSVGRSR